MKYNGPSEFRPMSAWAYFGLEILYSIPIIGFIFLLIHAIGAQNVNKRSFARSYFCVLLIVIVLCVVLVVAGIAGGWIDQLRELIAQQVNA